MGVDVIPWGKSIFPVLSMLSLSWYSTIIGILIVQVCLSSHVDNPTHRGNVIWTGKIVFMYLKIYMYTYVFLHVYTHTHRDMCVCAYAWVTIKSKLWIWEQEGAC